PQVLGEAGAARGYTMSEAARIGGKLAGPLATAVLVNSRNYTGVFIIAGGFYVLCAIFGLLSLGCRAVPNLSRPPQPVPATAENRPTWIRELLSSIVVYATAMGLLSQVSTWLSVYMDGLKTAVLASWVMVTSSVVAGPILLALAHRMGTYSDASLRQLMTLGTI